MNTLRIKETLLAAALFCVPAALHAQDTVNLPISLQGDASFPLAERGWSRDRVEVEFGEPEYASAQVGEPPISVWHYQEFSVYFEGDTVLHSVRRHHANAAN